MSLINKEKLQEFWTYASTWITARFVAQEDGKGLSTNDYTTTEKEKLAGIATGANKYTLPTAGSALGGVKTTSTVTDASGYTAVPIIGGVPYYKDTNTTYSNMKAATSSAAGTTGLVPAPAAGAQAKFLRGDGTWQTPANTTYSAATQSANGLMTSTDKKKLDAFSDASAYVLKTDISGAYRYKGSVATENALPTSGLTAGDVYNIVAESSYGAAGMNVAWTGSEWDNLGGIFELDIITSEEIAAMFA